MGSRALRRRLPPVVPRRLGCSWRQLTFLWSAGLQSESEFRMRIWNLGSACQRRTEMSVTRRDREVDPPHRGPAAPPATRLRADARANRVRVLEAAEQVFGTTGVAASMEEIAATAGVGIGTLYRNFPTKEALLPGRSTFNRLARLVAGRRGAEQRGAKPARPLFGPSSPSWSSSPRSEAHLRRRAVRGRASTVRRPSPQGRPGAAARDRRATSTGPREAGTVRPRGGSRRLGWRCWPARAWPPSTPGGTPR